MLRIAAKHADTWNLVTGGWDDSRDEMLARVRRTAGQFDDLCAEVGRDPEAVRRSLLVFGSEAKTTFDSVDAFEGVVRRYRDAGVTEFIFLYPIESRQLSVLERAGREVIPRLRAAAA